MKRFQDYGEKKFIKWSSSAYQPLNKKKDKGM